jgi:hypothetical protein
VAFGYSASGDRASQAEIHDKLKAAKSVDVRYDPADPATSALSFGIHRSIRFFIVFAVTWLAFVFGFTLIWWVSTANDGVLLQNISVQ